MSNISNINDAIGKIIEMATNDEDLKNDLMNNPKKTLSVFGIDLNDEVKFVFTNGEKVDEDENTIVINLDGTEEEEMDLEESSLENVTGGAGGFMNIMGKIEGKVRVAKKNLDTGNSFQNEGVRDDYSKTFSFSAVNSFANHNNGWKSFLESSSQDESVRDDYETTTADNNNDSQFDNAQSVSSIGPKDVSDGFESSDMDFNQSYDAPEFENPAGIEDINKNPDFNSQSERPAEPLDMDSDIDEAKPNSSIGPKDVSDNFQNIDSSIDDFNESIADQDVDSLDIDQDVDKPDDFRKSSRPR